MMAQFVDLKNRVLLSSLLIITIGLAIYFSTNVVVQFLIFVGVAILSIVGIWEYLRMLKTKEIDLPFWLLAVLAAVFIFANYLATLNFNVSVISTMVIAAAFFAVFLYHFAKIEGALVNIPTCLFTVFYVVLPLALMLRILYPASIPSSFVDGRIWLAYVIVVTKITDVGAYFAGKLWGKSKLAPSLSPKKTLAGAIAGFFSAVVLSVIFYFISEMTPQSIFNITLIQSLVLGGFIGVFGQLGDLAESLLKRDANVKDSNSIPGIGGVLDLLDSLLFTAPIVYIFLRTMPA